MAKRKCKIQKLKQDAVRWARCNSESVSKIARDSGLKKNMFGYWCREQDVDDPNAFRRHGNARDGEFAHTEGHAH